MNIFNAQPLNANTKGLDSASGSGMGALENQLMLDPEALKLLEGKALAEGVNFEQVLKASKNGQDPDAVIDLLKSEQDNNTKKALGSLSNSDEVESELDQPKNASLKTNENSSLKKQSSELNLLLNSNKSVDIKDPRNLTGNDTKIETGSADKKTPAANATAKPMTAASLGLGASFGLTKQGNIQQGNIAQANLQQLNHEQNTSKPIDKTLGDSKVGTGSNNLLKLSDFMAKQSPSFKTNAAKKAYQPIAKSMFDKKVESSLPGALKKPNTELKVQDIILGKMDNEAQDESAMNQNSGTEQNSSTKVNKAQSGTKVFDVNQLQSSNTTEQVITKIQDYVMQAKASKQPEVQMSFKHDDLGQIDLLVKKADGDSLNISVATRAAEGAEFFTKNQGELLKTLAQSGLQIGEFKLETSQGSSNNQSTAQDSSKQQFGQEGKGQHQSENGQKDADSKKREELWNQFQDKEVA